MSEYFVRFSPRQRAEHIAVMTAFTVLAVTGLPQKFFEAAASRWIFELLGGVDRARWIHRAAGFTFLFLTANHLAGATWNVLTGKAPLSLVPTKQDFLDAIEQMRFYLGVTDHQAKFDRFDYRQKFEYWGLVLGAVVVIVTGVILIWPVATARWLPGEVIPAAKVAHSSEGLMAFLVVIIWHIYNAHLNPDVFPFDTCIFTGRISRERMVHEHPLELERLEPGATAGHGHAPGAPTTSARAS